MNRLSATHRMCNKATDLEKPVSQGGQQQVIDTTATGNNTRPNVIANIRQPVDFLLGAQTRFLISGLPVILWIRFVGFIFLVLTIFCHWNRSIEQCSHLIFCHWLKVASCGDVLVQNIY